MPIIIMFLSFKMVGFLLLQSPNFVSVLSVIDIVAVTIFVKINIIIIFFYFLLLALLSCHLFQLHLCHFIVTPFSFSFLLQHCHSFQAILYSLLYYHLHCWLLLLVLLMMFLPPSKYCHDLAVIVDNFVIGMTQFRCS